MQSLQMQFKGAKFENKVHKSPGIFLAIVFDFLKSQV